MLRGVRKTDSKSPMVSPAFVPPMLAKLVRALPDGLGWALEVKFDGYRVEAIIDGAKIRLFSRRGNDFTKRFFKVAEAVSKINAISAVLDGEVVAVDSSGHVSFQMLQNRAKLSKGWQLLYYAFDLLYLNGKDLLKTPLKERRANLEKLLQGSPVKFSASLQGSADVVIKAVRQHGMEGIVAKKLDSVYQPGERSGAWLKLPLKTKGEFVIGGYRPEGSSLELLVVGYYKGNKLLFTGKVRQGLNPGIRSVLLKGLQTIRTAECPFSNLPKSRKGQWGERITAAEMGDYVWLEPRVVAEIKFTEWTSGGVLRHPQFVGIREDKTPDEATCKQ